MPQPTEIDIDIDPAWSISGHPHGGYLLRLMTAPVLDEQHPHPLAVGAHFVSSPVPGAGELTVERLRTGRRASTSRVRLSQGSDIRAEVLVTAGALTSGAAAWAAPGHGLSLPPLAECLRAPSLAPGAPERARVGHLDFLDLRLDAPSVAWALGSPGRTGELRAWLQRDDGAAPDVLDLLVFADALPPVTFDLGLPGWAPTVELTVLLRGLPAPGWCRAVQRTRLLQGGWFDEECEVWDSAGHLVVQARQLAGYREAPAARGAELPG